MRNIVCAVIVSVALPSSFAVAGDIAFEGTWHTTNRKLDGAMMCIVTDLGNEQWRGRFYGVWQGVPFDYTVPFRGKPSDLRGTATIDGADYVWTGQMTEETPQSFKGSFGGSRYMGHFDLKAKGAVAARK